jgi:hypothetical protein
VGYALSLLSRLVSVTGTMGKDTSKTGGQTASRDRRKAYENIAFRPKQNDQAPINVVPPVACYYLQESEVQALCSNNLCHALRRGFDVLNRRGSGGQLRHHAGTGTNSPNTFATTPGRHSHTPSSQMAALTAAWQAEDRVRAPHKDYGKLTPLLLGYTFDAHD